jgi:hypothetical protein
LGYIFSLSPLPHRIPLPLLAAIHCISLAWDTREKNAATHHLAENGEPALSSVIKTVLFLRENGSYSE